MSLENNFNNLEIVREFEYDLLNTDLDKARSLMKDSDGKRFRILLEIAKGCYGNCEGCSLSVIDRREISPAMEINRIKKVFDYFSPIINEKTNIKTSVVNFGVGDYFMLDDDFLEELFKETDIFFKSLHTPRNVLTVSTSLFLNPEKMGKKLEIMTKYLHPNQFAFDVVIDPFRLSKNKATYSKNIDALSQKFPFFDFVVNIANGLTPEHASEVVEFLKEKNVLNMDIQYAINNTNNYRVKIPQDKFNDFIDIFYQNIDKDIMDLSIAQATNSSEGVIMEEIEKQADEILNERLAINEVGDIFPIGFAFGDIILDSRYDFPAIGNISMPLDIPKAKEKIVNYLKALFLKNKVCHTCEYNKKCYGTGYGFYNKFSTDSKKCENLGLFIFKK